VPERAIREIKYMDVNELIGRLKEAREAYDKNSEEQTSFNRNP